MSNVYAYILPGSIGSRFSSELLELARKIPLLTLIARPSGKTSMSLIVQSVSVADEAAKTFSAPLRPLLTTANYPFSSQLINSPAIWSLFASIIIM